MPSMPTEEEKRLTKTTYYQPAYFHYDPYKCKLCDHTDYSKGINTAMDVPDALGSII